MLRAGKVSNPSSLSRTTSTHPRSDVRAASTECALPQIQSEFMRHIYLWLRTSQWISSWIRKHAGVGRENFTLHNPLNEIPPKAQQLHGIQLYIADDNLATSVLLSKPDGLSVYLIMDLRDLIKQSDPILHSLIPAIDRFPLIMVHRFLKGTSYTNQPPAGADQIAVVRMVGPDLDCNSRKQEGACKV